MNAKQKIALFNLKQDLEREIITEDQARSKFREIMGLDADDVSEEELESATMLGKSQYSSDEDLEETTESETSKETQQVDQIDPDPETESSEKTQEVIQDEAPENTVDLSLNPPTDKMVEKRLTKAKKPKQK